MNPLVLFGAGRNAVSAYVKFLSEGISPVCFCDNNPQKAYQVMPQCGGLSIFPLEKVMSLYPEAIFFVTTNIPAKFEIIDNLVAHGVSEQRIINYESTTKRLGCTFVERVLQINDSGFFFCCIEGNNSCRPVTTVDMNSNTEDMFLSYEELYKRTNRSILEHSKNGFCDGCPEIKVAPYPQKRRLETFTILTGYVCQFNCVYCHRPKFLPNAQRENNIEKTLAFIKYLKDRDIIDNSTKMTLCNGEITANHMETKIFEAIIDHPINILTNGYIYSKNIKEALERGRSFVLISLDSGTDETFKKVKGVNDDSCFKRVCANIQRYAKYGHVELKYILLPGLNDNTNDVDGFLDLASKCNLNVVLSRDVFGLELFDNEIESMLPIITYFMDGVYKRKLNISFEHYFCSGQHKQRIAEALNLNKIR